MNNTDIEKNTTTPQDCDKLLRYLYQLKYSDPSNAGKITKIMTNSDFENRLPAQLPKDIIIAHKIGTGIAQVHDVGLIVLEKRPYTISVFSKNITDETKAEENIAKISKVTYDFFQNLNK
jgi:beta-lactamase class A